MIAFPEFSWDSCSLREANCTSSLTLIEFIPTVIVIDSGLNTWLNWGQRDIYWGCLEKKSVLSSSRKWQRRLVALCNYWQPFYYHNGNWTEGETNHKVWKPWEIAGKLKLSSKLWTFSYIDLTFSRSRVPPLCSIWH